MAKSLSPREVKQLKRDAAEFARRAKVGRTYYYVSEYVKRFKGDSLPKYLLSEIKFQKPSKSSRLLGGNVPRWYGPLTAENAYMDCGPLYEDRDHPAIRGMQTLSEYTEAAEKLSDAIRSGQMF